MNQAIRLSTLGHSCVLVELVGEDGVTAKVLLDPGSLTPPLEPIDGLDAILVTHAHPDHVDPAQVNRLRADGPVPVFGDATTAKVLGEAEVVDVTVVAPGEVTIAGVRIDVSEWKHQDIYPGVPVPVDFGYLIDGRVFAPGDAFAIPEFAVDTLLLPTGAPWMKLAETIDYMRTISPRTVIPVHDGGLAPAHREMHRGLMQKFAPEGTTVLRPSIGDEITLDPVG